MTIQELTEQQQTIINILQEHACYSEDTAMRPTDLISKCRERNIPDIDALERALVQLIDLDVIEYEMNDKADVSSLWLMIEQKSLV